MADIIGWDEAGPWTEADTQRVLEYLREHGKSRPAQPGVVSPARDPDQGPRPSSTGPECL
jgi:hypothetical protein